MTSVYLRRTPFDPAPAACYPSRRLLECAACSRWRKGRAIASGRDEVVIDASTVATSDALCPMFADSESVQTMPAQPLQVVAQCAHRNHADAARRDEWTT